MQQSQATPGKKLKLSVHSDHAQALQSQGQKFWSAIKGRTISPDDRVAFQGMLLEVKGTKPKGAIQVAERTAIKMEVSKSPVTLTCAQCGQEHDSPRESCSSCGQGLPLVAL